MADTNWQDAQLQAAREMAADLNRSITALAEQLRSDGFEVTFEHGAMVVRMPAQELRCQHCGAKIEKIGADHPHWLVVAPAIVAEFSRAQCPENDTGHQPAGGGDA